MAGTYTSFTLADALGDMGERLYDPNHIHWVDAELTIYIQEAIRTFNALTNHFREEGSFSSTVNQAFYDLPTVLPTLRAQTFTTLRAVNQICYQLLEPPPVGNLWVGTEQYSLADILSALQQARDTFLLETGIVITESSVAVDPFPSDGQVDLNDSIINLRRLSWRQGNGIETVVRRDDTWGFTNYRTDWQASVAAPPTAYSISTTPPLVVQLGPISSQTGTLKLLTIDHGATPNLLSANQSLGVPNDWAWVVIMGALAQLFQRDGLALDVGRAKYCEARWDDGLDRAKAAAVVMAATVNGLNTPLGAVSDADAYSSSWPMVSGNPRRALTMGHTLVGLWPPPGVPVGGGSYTVALDVVRNAPIPVDPADYLQIGDELINDVLDYAQHLAQVKEGAGQIDAAMGLLEQFTGVCKTTIDVKRASQPAADAAEDQTVQDRRTVAYEIANG